MGGTLCLDPLKAVGVAERAGRPQGLLRKLLESNKYVEASLQDFYVIHGGQKKALLEAIRAPKRYEYDRACISRDNWRTCYNAGYLLSIVRAYRGLIRRVLATPKAPLIIETDKLYIMIAPLAE